MSAAMYRIRRRLAITGLLVGLGAGATGIDPAGAASVAAPEHPFAVSCHSIIENGVDPGRSGYRVVLGTISVPPSFNPDVVPVHGPGRWTFWRKAGVAVRVGTSVTVRVPAAWRSRAAITWGDSPVVSALRFDGCGSASGGAGRWEAYAGGFYLRASGACVPLVFTSGHRRTTVHFGVGRRCR